MPRNFSIVEVLVRMTKIDEISSKKIRIFSHFDLAILPKIKYNLLNHIFGMTADSPWLIITRLRKVYVVNINKVRGGAVRNF